ncbi:DUF2383 domain-containing protein [Rhodanobacter umsongensis]|uniref:DUF2383 domain-containing protein n=1 Tax=Rhodanobacter umsongensis TaxID=633153 RepID=A0ABW0JKC1_9GAMM
MPRHVSSSTCNALIRRSIDLRRLYRHAAAACEPGVRVVLNENVQALDLLIADLQAQGRAGGGTPSCHGSWRGTASRHLASWLAHADTHRDRVWIRALAHHESALLRAFEQAIEVEPPGSAQTLQRQLPRLRGIHLDMHSLTGTAH